MFLISQLPWETWARFGVWLLIGFAIYSAHDRRHALLNPGSPHHRPAVPAPPRE
ncbi:C-terminus of AA_permease [Geodermatophilus obscurus]|uniref:C-terminus of AA_permease n=1 Tax=Geodermatophilus obscurus TaxID=1861 RepID=A0A1M7U0X6_9ACTN|nr:amino acid permease C-terminal domain-containing protein [Geodermatophilus obscurus]SHN76553.1 C-terminus of AA_permease [Geodermatophilus obscurus]